MITENSCQEACQNEWDWVNTCHKAWIDSGRIFYLQLHITGYCNLKCKHCYIEGSPTPDRLNPALVHGIIAQFDRMSKIIGARGKIYFTGGEPLLDPNLEEYITDAANRGMITMILSNGTLIDDTKAQSLKQAGLQIVQISIDGNQSTHDYIRGRRTFAKATKALDACRKANLTTVAMMTINRLNAKNVKDVVQFCVNHGVNRFSFGRLVPTGSGRNLYDEVLSKCELRSFFRTMKRLENKYKNRLEFSLHDPVWMAYTKVKNTYGCSVGKGGICITESGDIMPCRRLDVAIGNIKKISLLEAWYSDELDILRYRDHHEGKCGNCKRKSSCGGCRAIARAINNSCLAEDPQCMVE